MLKSIGLIRTSRTGLINSLWSRYQHQPASVKQETVNITEKALDETKPTEKLTFAQMFKESKFVALGDLENKYLVGKIVDIVGDDLYIDYGGKFNCVVKRPEKGASYYKRNRNVKIKLISFEMASYFLNSAKHITLLESDAEVIGLLKRDEEQDERSKLLRKEIDELNSEPYY